MVTWTVSTTLYVAANHAQDEGVDPVVAQLKDHAWTVINADVTPKPSGAGNLWGTLAEDQPVSFLLARPGSSKADAENDVKAAITDTGNFSVAKKVTVTVGKIGDVVDKVAGAAGNIADNPQGAFSALKWVAIAAAVAGVVYLAFQAKTLIRGVA